MTDQSLSKIFVKGEFSKRFFDMSATAVGLINSFLIITFLSVFNFGLYQLILAFVAILDGLNIKNLDGPISAEMRHYFSAGDKPRAKRVFYEIAVWRIGFAMLAGIVIFSGSNIIAGLYGDNIGLLIKIASPLLIFLSLHSLIGIFLKSVISFGHWGIPAAREVSKLLIILMLISFFEFTIVGVVAAHVASELIAVMLVFFTVALKKFRTTFENIRANTGFMIFQFLKTHGKWIFLLFGLSRITKSAMPWFIKFFVNTEAVAFYSLAINLIAFIEGLMPIAGISPLFLLKLDKKEEMAFIFKRSVKYVFWLGIIFAVLGFFFVPPLISWIFPKYAPALPIFKLMLLALPVYGVYKILKSVIAALREYKIMTLRTLNEVIIIIAGSIIFLPLLGVLGAGVVYVSTFLERSGFFYKQLAKKHPEFKMKLKSLILLDSDDKAIFAAAIKRFFYSARSFLRRI